MKVVGIKTTYRLCECHYVNCQKGQRISVFRQGETFRGRNFKRAQEELLSAKMGQETRGY